MSPGLSPDFKELVRARTDIVQLIGETCALQSRRGGAEFVGLCPFHDDHNPSLTVSPERQSYKCWSCGEGGDCFSFVQKIENVGFREALEMLASRANLELPKTAGSRSRGGEQSKNRLYEVLTWAENEFFRCLQSSPEAAGAREYLKQRGFEQETVNRFRLGYHPREWEWILNRARGRFSTQELFATRLVSEQQGRDGYRDYFVNRVLFPIRDSRARTVAFGGRILPGEANGNLPKYFNSPESVVFPKSRLLYGFDLARDAVRRSKTAVVMEGYTDCIMAHQHGIANAVGTLGTALTEAHVTALKRFAHKVVLVYDGDEAGRNAAEKSLSKFLAQEVDLRILTLPAGADPADYLSQYGPEAFEHLVEDAPEAWQYKLGLSIERYGLDSVDARDRILNEMLELFVQAPGSWNMARKNLLLTRLAGRLGLTETFVRQQLDQTRKKASSRKKTVTTVKSNDGGGRSGGLTGKLRKQDLLERELLEIVFAAPETVGRIRQTIEAEELQSEPLRRLLQLCYELAERGLVPSYGEVVSHLEDPEQKRLAIELEEQSREKEIASKLRVDEAEAKGEGGPAFLVRTLQSFACRRMEDDQQLVKGQMALSSAEGGRLDEETRTRLRQAMELQRIKASLKSTN